MSDPYRVQVWVADQRKRALFADSAMALGLVCLAAGLAQVAWMCLRSLGLFEILILPPLLVATYILAGLAWKWLPEHWQTWRALRDLDPAAGARILLTIAAAPRSVPVSELARVAPGHDIEGTLLALQAIAGLARLPGPPPSMVWPPGARERAAKTLGFAPGAVGRFVDVGR